jgi:hypothetical protein
MSFIAATALEMALFRKFYELYGSQGFPAPALIRVRDRENTGAGRYVDLQVDGAIDLDNGYLDLGGKFIEMDDVPNGLMAAIRVKDHRPDQLEIAVYGNDSWDGTERRWSIV